MIRIYNTLSRRKDELAPLQPGEIRMYVCGVTPYDVAHIGHARSAMAFDVIRRYLAFRGYRVRLVRNYTDVDDKIIRRANQEGVSAQEISERYIATDHDDMTALGILPPDVAPKCTEHVPQMLRLIEELVGRGMAYPVDGDVYFEVARFPSYGQLSGKNLDELLAGARVDVDERKRDPRDFALWKAAKPGEPTWSSPWGPGRPGWHIECSAMAMEHLGETLDIHGGGEDLIFPHHECEIAQSEGATDKPFSRIWMHNGMMNLGAEKMSKSLGNTLAIRELLGRHDPEAVRLWFLETHYRNPLEWSEDRLRDAKSKRDELRAVVATGEALASSEGRLFALLTDRQPDTLLVERLLSGIEGHGLRNGVASCVSRFSEGMNDDFNTPRALAALYRLGDILRKARPLPAGGPQSEQVSFLSGVEIFLALARTLGLLQRPGGYTYKRTLAGEVGLTPAVTLSAELRSRIDALVDQREEARRARDWKRADQLRNELQALGVTVEDTRAGPRWIRSPRDQGREDR